MKVLGCDYFICTHRMYEMGSSEVPPSTFESCARDCENRGASVEMTMVDADAEYFFWSLFWSW